MFCNWSLSCDARRQEWEDGVELQREQHELITSRALVVGLLRRFSETLVSGFLFTNPLINQFCNLISHSIMFKWIIYKPSEKAGGIVSPAGRALRLCPLTAGRAEWNQSQRKADYREMHQSKVNISEELSCSFRLYWQHPHLFTYSPRMISQKEFSELEVNWKYNLGKIFF